LCATLPDAKPWLKRLTAATFGEESMARPSLFRVVFVGLLLAGSAIVARADQTIKLVHPLTPEMRAVAEYSFSHHAKAIDFLRDSNKDLQTMLDQMSGAMADIDGDGVDELFLHPPNDFLLCGTVGCAVWILTKGEEGEEETWGFLGEFTDYAMEFTILDKTDHGVHEIVTYFGGVRNPVVAKWDRHRYLYFPTD
jgi:hypothetical protein